MFAITRPRSPEPRVRLAGSRSPPAGPRSTLPGRPRPSKSEARHGRCARSRTLYVQSSHPRPRPWTRRSGTARTGTAAVVRWVGFWPGRLRTNPRTAQAELRLGGFQTACSRPRNGVQRPPGRPPPTGLSHVDRRGQAYSILGRADNGVSARAEGQYVYAYVSVSKCVNGAVSSGEPRREARRARRTLAGARGGTMRERGKEAFTE